MLKEKLKKNYNGVADCSVEFTQFGTIRFAKGAEKDGLVSILYSLVLSGLPKWPKKMARFPFFTQFGTFWLARGAERDGSLLAFSNQR